MQCACAILSSVACPALQYFSVLSHKRYDFRKKKIVEHDIGVVISCTNLSETFLIQRRNERDVVQNVYRSSCKVPFYFCSIVMKFEFSRQFFPKKKIVKYQIS